MHEQRNCIQAEFELIRPDDWPVGLNPVWKRRLLVWRNGADLQIMEMPDVGGGGGGGDGSSSGGVNGGIEGGINDGGNGGVSMPFGGIGGIDLTGGSSNGGVMEAIVGRTFNQYHELSTQATSEAGNRDKAFAGL